MSNVSKQLIAKFGDAVIEIRYSKEVDHELIKRLASEIFYHLSEQRPIDANIYEAGIPEGPVEPPTVEASDLARILPAAAPWSEDLSWDSKHSEDSHD